MSFKLLKDVKYFDGSLWYQVDWASRKKLLTNKNKLKQFIVVDVTKDKVYSKDVFILENIAEDNEFVKDVSTERVLQALDTIKYKVFKKIKIRD